MEMCLTISSQRVIDHPESPPDTFLRPGHSDLLHYFEDSDLLPSGHTANKQKVLVNASCSLLELIDFDKGPAELLHFLYHFTRLPNDMPNHIGG